MDRHDSDRSARFVTDRLPWVLAVAMFGVYAATLNHWVTLESLRLVGRVSGLNWRQELVGPVTFLVTYPLGWLPQPWVPAALNIFTAVCAAGSLGLLARSVALLPHDRTHAERRRLRSSVPYLTIRTAWLPPAFAVVVCGCQLTFWGQAVAATGEMLDLLLFAALVWCLVQFRARQEGRWLLGFGGLYGLAAANNWAMVAFGPAFLAAVLWMAFHPLKRRVIEERWKALRAAGAGRWGRLLALLSWVLDLRLLIRVALCGLSGFALVFLLPLLASLPGPRHLDFWPALRVNVAAYASRLLHFQKYEVLVACLTSLVPVLFMGIRWRRSREEEDRVMKNVGDGFLHLVQGFFLVMCLWTLLDSPFSPRGLKLGAPGLPLYYLSALSVGYFSGCFLLVFGRTRSPPPMRYVNRLLAACVWLLAVGTPALLLCKNLPTLLRGRTSPLAGYMSRLRQSLPPEAAVVLSDDPFRLLCLEMALARSGDGAEYLPIDTSLLSRGLPYLQFLQQQHPGIRLGGEGKNDLAELANPRALQERLGDLAREGRVFYLHPGFGALLIALRASPRGLACQLKPRGTNRTEAVAMSPAELEENRAFWAKAQREELAELLRRIQAPPPVRPAFVRQFLNRIHVLPGADFEAAGVGALYSAGLDCWGVELQRQGLLAEARQCFESALALSPENAAAQLNLEANRTLQARGAPAVQSSAEVEARLGGARHWEQVLVAFGPLDEANCCFHLGNYLVKASLYGQAVEQFQRVRALAPGYPELGPALAQAQLKHGDSGQALAVAQEMLRKNPQDAEALLVKGLALFETGDYAGAIPPLTEVLSLQSTNQPARLYRAWSYWKLNRLDEARQDYETVLHASPSEYRALYALADIAYRSNDTASAVRDCEQYLACAPPNLPETLEIKDRLRELKARSP